MENDTLVVMIVAIVAVVGIVGLVISVGGRSGSVSLPSTVVSAADTSGNSAGAATLARQIVTGPDGRKWDCTYYSTSNGQRSSCVPA